MLQSDFFDNETEALIDLNVIYGAGKRITDKCLIIFSKEIHTYLLEHPIITHHLLTTLLLNIVMCWQRYLKK